MVGSGPGLFGRVRGSVGSNAEWWFNAVSRDRGVPEWDVPIKNGCEPGIRGGAQIHGLPSILI